MSVIVRKVEKSDEKSLRDLYQASINDNPDGFIQDLSSQPDIIDFAYSLEKEGGLLLVMYYHHKLIGMGGLRKIDKDNSMELCKLHILAKFKGMGLGKYLANELISKARDLSCKEVVLHVTKTQNQAIGLYERLGFEKTLEKTYQVGSQSFDTAHYRLML